jgi:hypothetical protein
MPLYLSNTKLLKLLISCLYVTFKMKNSELGGRVLNGGQTKIFTVGKQEED